MINQRVISTKKATPWILGITLALAADGGLAHEQSDKNVGVVAFDIACNDSSQVAMNRAVAQLHNMMYVEAEGIFNDAITAEPECAMLHWGVAMTNFHPLWPGTTTEPEMLRGTAAINRALTIGGANAREKAYINAAAAFYEGNSDTTIPGRIAAWAEQHRALHEKFPDDVDATAFYALAHLSVAPKGDKTFAHQKSAGKLLEKLHAKYPEHPAGFHYLIHAYDNPLLASKAETVSRAYDKLAPSVPHALHMPSHIFVRMGLWNETIFWNDRSAKAALESASEEVTSMHYAHAIDYKVYAHLQRGEMAKAIGDVDELLTIKNHQNGFAAAYALAAAPARLVLETDNWKEASVLPDELHSAIDWSRLPAVVAINHFAQGIGAARAGDLPAAKAAEQKLHDLHEELKINGPAYWEVLVDSQHKSVKGWIEFAKGNETEALQLMLAAADMEDSVGKSPVTPSAVLPARELYADMLSLLGKHAEALQAYESALSISPNRTRSLRGAMRAAESLGEKDKAALYKQAIG